MKERFDIAMEARNLALYSVQSKFPIYIQCSTTAHAMRPSKIRADLLFSVLFLRKTLLHIPRGVFPNAILSTEIMRHHIHCHFQVFPTPLLAALHHCTNHTTHWASSLRAQSTGQRSLICVSWLFEDWTPLHVGHPLALRK